MWNPLKWFRRSSRALDIPTTDNGNDAHRARQDAELALDEAKLEAAKVDRLVRRAPRAMRDQFAEDLKRAFGT